LVVARHSQSRVALGVAVAVREMRHTCFSLPVARTLNYVVVAQPGSGTRVDLQWPSLATLADTSTLDAGLDLGDCERELYRDTLFLSVRGDVHRGWFRASGRRGQRTT
tara:strand:+ start:20623 stop:20946 length:324 start_codon:yes stop_codon:yes gene_type:complete